MVAKIILAATVDQITDIYLHDAALDKINCDYKNRKLTVTSFSEVPGKIGWTETLEFFEVSLVNIPIFEPWGTGFYINEITVSLDLEKAENSEVLKNKCNQFLTKILLNSGDEIKIQSTRILYYSIPPEV